MIKNSFFNASITLSGPIVNLISLPIALKGLGPQSFGEASIALSLISYFSIISTLGLAIYGTRELAAVRNCQVKFAKVFSELLLLSIVASIVGALIYALFAWLILSLTSLLIVLGGLSLALNFLNIEWLYYSRENYKMIAYSSIVTRLICLGLIFSFVHQPEDSYKYIAILIVSNLLPAIVTFSLHNLYTRIAFSGLQPWRHLEAIRVFLYIRIFSSIYSVLDTVIVGLFAGPAIAALYTVAIRVARIICSVVCSMTAVAMPRASALNAISDNKAYNNLLANTLVFTIILSSIASTFVLLLSSSIVFYLGGSNFSSSASALAILSLLTPIVALSNFLAMQILYPKNIERGVFISLGLGSMSYLFFASILLVFFGLNGAAVAILISELTILIVQIYIAKSSILALYNICKSRLNRLAAVTLLFHGASVLLFVLLKDLGLLSSIVITLALIMFYLVCLTLIRENLVSNVIARYAQ